MALGIEVGLGPGYIVLDWDPALSPNKSSAIAEKADHCIAS